MNVPLKWLADYVDLPKDVKTLTDRLTSIGHMLDKVSKRVGDTVVDLELRGNRADMFGLIGVAREVAAAFNKTLRLPPISPLPKTDPKSPLVFVDPPAKDLVKRYIAVKLEVSVGPSPKWLTDRLMAYGLEPINNVVDVTNYVMIETSHPLHAFDFDKLNGRRLILRRGKAGEQFATIRQGTTLTLTPEDLAISDTQSVACLNIIGGLKTKVSSDTANIILETAVYNPISSRRTARRHKIFTESGSRHEKHQDPAELPFTLSRAVQLLRETASAKITSDVSDYYPHPVRPTVITFSPSEVTRLTGLTVPPTQLASVLTSLGFTVSGPKVIVPTFRTDVNGPADIIEEVVRLVGYDRLPHIPLSGPIPDPQTYPAYSLQEKIRDVLVSLGVSEAITSTFTSVSVPNSVRLVNPPDPGTPFLRHSLAPNLTTYAQKLLHRKVSRVILFEIGKVFTRVRNIYVEKLHLCLALAGSQSRPNWRAPAPRPLDIYDLTGLVSTFQRLTGWENLSGNYSSFADILTFETDLSPFSHISDSTDVYSLAPAYPPIIEDINISFTHPYTRLVKKIHKASPLIQKIELVDKYGDKLTLRLTYHSDTKQLSSKDLIPIRDKLFQLLPAQS